MLIFTSAPSYAGEPATFKISPPSCDNHAPEINNRGDVVWRAFCKGENHVYISEAGKARRLTKNGATGQNPRINASGTVVWQGMEKNSTMISLYKNKEIKTLMKEGIRTYVAPSLNDRGDVIWQGVIEEKDEKGRQRITNAIFLFDGKNTRKLDAGTPIARTPDINNNGAVAFQGWVDKPDPVTKEISYGYTGVYEIFVLDKNGIKRLTDSRTYMDNQAPMINDNGFVVWSGQTDGKTSEIYLYDGAAVKRLTSNNRDDRSPRINNKGEVVWYGFDGRRFQIFFYGGKSVVQLTNNDHDNVEPYVNDRGDIVWAARTGEYYQIKKMRLKR